MALSRREFRRVGKWAGLAAVVLVVGMFVGSRWLDAYGVDPFGQGIEIGNGALHVHWGIRQGPPRWAAGIHRLDYLIVAKMNGQDPFRWWFGVQRYTAAGGFVWIPLWFIAIVTSLPTAWLWWRDRRDNGPGHCSTCGYDLRGLTAGAKCPECGKVSAATSS